VTKLWQLMEMGGMVLWTNFFSLIYLLQIMGDGIVIVILYFDNNWHWFMSSSSCCWRYLDECELI
jgi:hypothetical protein